MAFAVIERSFPPDDFATLLLYAGVACFAWRPLIATFVVASIGTLGVVLFGGANFLLLLAFITALVTVTCSRRWIAAYVTLIVFLTMYAAIADTNLTTFGPIGVAGAALIAAIIGIGFRLAAARGRRAEAEQERAIRDLTRLTEQQYDRLADDLHDGIAHDLTLVLFHARALPLHTEASDREISLTAITSSAERALTGIRSLLTVLRDTDDVRHDTLTPYGERFADVATSLAGVLEQIGITCRLTLPSPLPDLPPEGARELSATAIEAVTNIVKHAPRSLSSDIAVYDRGSDVELVVMNTTPANKRFPRHGERRGLARLQARVERLGGHLRTEPTVTGWVVHLSLPLDQHDRTL